MVKSVILRDLDDASPTPVQIETESDLGALIGQQILTFFGNLLGALGNLITGGGSSGNEELLNQLQQTQAELEKMKKIMYVLVAVIVVLMIVMTVRR